MKSAVLLSAVAVAVAAVDGAQGGGRNHTSAAYVDNSLVNSLLLAAGYSDKCVASALDTCGPATIPTMARSVEQHVPVIMQEAKQLLQEVRQSLGQQESRLRNCKDLQDAGDSGRGIRHVYPYAIQPHRRVSVFCDHTIDGGGWTVIQRRTANVTYREDFYRFWHEYRIGFGDLEGEFWLGLDIIHELTNTVRQELRIELTDYDREEKIAKYGFFYVGDEASNFVLSIRRPSGPAGDSLFNEGNGATFSAQDSRHPGSKHSCAQRNKGAWWYGPCQWSNLNGFPHHGIHPNTEGIYWKSWLGNKYSLKDVAMMIRPAP